jgi:IS30 family transposase
VKKNTPKETKKYTHLTLAEREEIAICLSHGMTQREIAGKLNRNPATVSREILRNSPKTRNVHYRANRAQLRSEDRKAKSHDRKRIPNEKIRNYIIKGLDNDWSPELIAARLSKDRPALKTNYESIYQWIYTERRDLIAKLAYHHRKRRNRASGRNKRGVKIQNRTMIEQRPVSAGNRGEAGHWEADTAVSRESGAAIMAVVERKSRFLMARKLPAKTAGYMRLALVSCLLVLPRRLRKTITYDNGTENAGHEKTNDRLHTRSYFCNPYHSWEKGSIENRIGIIRRYFPKKTDWALITQRELNRIIKKINSRPMKCLGYKTPYEAFVALRS